MLVPEGLLDGVQLVAVRQTFDGHDLTAFGLDGEHGAGLDGLAVDDHRAGAALAGVAAHVRARETGDVAYVVHEQEAGFDFVLPPPPVDGGRDLVLHPLPPCCGLDT